MKKIKFSPRTLRNIAWIETHLRVPDGKLVGQPVKLSTEQKIWMEKIYGSPTRTIIISIPRKNAKTTLSAMIMLLHLAGPESVQSGQLYSAAQSREQAGILFNAAAKMVRMSPTLSQYVDVKETAKTLVCAELGTIYKALSADASTAFGLSPVFIVHDELGQVRGPKFDLYEALETASAAHESPLSIIISTQAARNDDLLSILIDDALTGADPKVKCVLYTVPEDKDPYDHKEIAKAQPNWHLMNHEEVFRQAAEAKRMPSREASYLNLICNRRIEVKNPFVTRAIWESCGSEPSDMDGQPVYIGLDLSSVSDLTAMVCVTQAGDVHPTFWLPAEGLFDKSKADRVPYDVWAKEGYLKTTPGKSIEYEFVAHHLRGLFDNYNIQALSFDRYNMRFLRPWLEKAGFSDQELEKFIDFGQGFASMSPALRELESKLLNGKLKHGNHPVLSMCAANATIVQDTAENRKFAKTKASGRIDGMVALAMAIGVMPNQVVDNDVAFNDMIMNPITLRN